MLSQRDHRGFKIKFHILLEVILIIQFKTCFTTLLLLSALPLSHTAPSSKAASDDFNESIILGERVAALEEFRRQQRDWNLEADQRLSGGIHDLSKGQGTQDEKISELESRLSSLYLLGTVGGAVIGLLSPFVFRAYIIRHNKIMKLYSKMRKIAELQGYSLSDLELGEEEPD